MAARPDDADDPVEEPVLGEPADESPGREQPPAETDQAHDEPESARDAAEPADIEPEPDVEAEWADIVARLGDIELAADSGSAPGRSPGGPDRPGEHRRADDANDPSAGRTIRPARRVDDPRSWLPDPVLEEAEDHFEPPDPGPVLGGDPLLTMAWATVVGVPVLLIVVAVLGSAVPGILMATAGGLLVAAVGLLLWRMPHGGDEDDRTGPGAVV